MRLWDVLLLVTVFFFHDEDLGPDLEQLVPADFLCDLSQNDVSFQESALEASCV